MNTLLQKAKQMPRVENAQKDYSHEEIEVAIAYLTGDISGPQLAHATGIKGSECYKWAAQRVTYAVRQRLLTLSGQLVGAR